jgi:hypothetical protein
MTCPRKMLSAALMLGWLIGAPGAVYAADDATANKCWGLATKQFAPLGTHASSQDEPRRGVGNVTKEDHGDLSEGGQGVHAANVAPPDAFDALPQECQDLREEEMP